MGRVTATRWGLIATIFLSTARTAGATTPDDEDTRSIGERRFIAMPTPVDFDSAFVPSYLAFRFAGGARLIETNEETGWTIPTAATLSGGLQFASLKDVDFGVEGGVGAASSFGNVLVDLGAGYAMTGRFAGGSSLRFGSTRVGAHLGWAGSAGRDLSVRSYLTDLQAGNGPPLGRLSTALARTSSDDWSASAAWATVMATWLTLQGAWRVDYVTSATDLWRANERRRLPVERNRLLYTFALAPAFSLGPVVLATTVGITRSRLEVADNPQRISTWTFIAGVQPSLLWPSGLRVGLGLIGQFQLDRREVGVNDVAITPPEARVEPAKQTAFDLLIHIERVF